MRLSNDSFLYSTSTSTLISTPALAPTSNSILKTKANNRLLKTLVKCIYLSPVFVLTLFLTTTINQANAALSATTANTIQGSKPYLKLSDGTKLTNLNQLLGFSMWDGTYESDGVTKHKIQVDASMASAAISIPSIVKFNDIEALVTANNIATSLSLSMQGDAGSPLGTVTATWYENGVQVNNLNQNLSVCGGPYRLKISANGVSAKTTYGVPNINNYGNGGPITYTFVPTGMGICNFCPASMKVWKGNSYCGVTATGVSPSGNGECKWAGGYNPSVWDGGTYTTSSFGRDQTGGGFKRNSGFPSTGFKGAKFDIIGSGNDQSRYRCSSPNGAGKICLSGGASTALGSNCTVTYTAGTKAAFTSGGSPTIKMEYNTTGSTWVTIDSYTIPVPTLWANVKALSRYNTATNFTGSYQAAALCGGTGLSGLADYTTASSYFFKRNEITNAPQADSGYITYNGSWTTVGAPKIGGYLSRDIGTFLGEWGQLHNGSGGSNTTVYTDSLFVVGEAFGGQLKHTQWEVSSLFSPSMEVLPVILQTVADILWCDEIKSWTHTFESLFNHLPATML